MTRRHNLKAALRDAVRTDFRAFARKAFKTVTGEEALSKDPYLNVFFKAGNDIVERRTRRLIVSVPPRHGKSLIFTVSLVAYELAKRSSAKIMVISRDEGLAREMAESIRNVMQANWYLDAFSTRLRKGQSRATDFVTTAGGRVVATSIDGGIAGYGADLIIVDDPADIKDAQSPSRLAEINGRFDTAIRSRLNNPKKDRIVIVAHRLSPDDLPGHLLREGGWSQIKLPLIAERDEEYPIDGGVWRRKKGEKLRPDAFDNDQIEVLRRKSVNPDFATLYQQAPAEASWKLVEGDFKVFSTIPPEAGGAVLSIDPAQVPRAGNSFSVVQVWQSTSSDHYLRDQWRGQATPKELEKRVRIILNEWRPSVVLIEAAGGGLHLAESLSKRAAREGFLVEPIIPGRRSKLSRFADVVPIIEVGKVHLPEHAPWRPEFLDELLSFPDGKHDDQADAFSQYLFWASMNPPAPKRPQRTVAYGRSATRTYVAGERHPPGAMKVFVYARKPRTR